MGGDEVVVGGGAGAVSGVGAREGSGRGEEALWPRMLVLVARTGGRVVGHGGRGRAGEGHGQRRGGAVVVVLEQGVTARSQTEAFI